MNVGGYGVEMALKNMEYKAIDDSAVKRGMLHFLEFLFSRLSLLVILL